MDANRTHASPPKPSRRRRPRGRPAHVTVLAFLLGLAAMPLIGAGTLVLASWHVHLSDEIEGLLATTSVPMALALTLVGLVSLVIGIALFVRVRWARAAARSLLLAGLFLSGLSAMYFVAMTCTAFFHSDANMAALHVWLSLFAHVGIWALFLVLRHASVEAWFEREVVPGTRG